jgi:hypothetical protein
VNTSSDRYAILPCLLLVDELSLGLAPVVVAQLLATTRNSTVADTTTVDVERSVTAALKLTEASRDEPLDVLERDARSAAEGPHNPQITAFDQAVHAASTHTEQPAGLSDRAEQGPVRLAAIARVCRHGPPTPGAGRWSESTAHVDS